VLYNPVLNDQEVLVYVELPPDLKADSRRLSEVLGELHSSLLENFAESADWIIDLITDA
jgi:hypothetical protein